MKLNEPKLIQETIERIPVADGKYLQIIRVLSFFFN